jgi:hypothetical protein
MYCGPEASEFSPDFYSLAALDVRMERPPCAVGSYPLANQHLPSRARNIGRYAIGFFPASITIMATVCPSSPSQQVGATSIGSETARNLRLFPSRGKANGATDCIDAEMAYLDPFPSVPVSVFPQKPGFIYGIENLALHTA